MNSIDMSDFGTPASPASVAECLLDILRWAEDTTVVIGGVPEAHRISDLTNETHTGNASTAIATARAVQLTIDLASLKESALQQLRLLKQTIGNTSGAMPN